MKATRKGAIAFILFIIYVFFSFTVGANALEEPKTQPRVALSDKNSSDFDISSRIYETIFGKGKTEKKNEPVMLIVGGDAFGIKINEERPTVTEIKSAGEFEVGDKILALDGVDIYSASDIQNVLKSSHGLPLEAVIERSGERKNITVTPTLEENGYKLNVSLKQSSVGIGTITFIEPNSNIFGGLGHGVCDSSGELVKMKSGVATSVILTGVNRGENGKPGELCGMLGKGILGDVVINSECGIFGRINAIPLSEETAIPMGERASVTLGEAEIVSTLKNGKKSSYTIEITDIDYSSTSSKSFKIKVTDPSLLAISGGIVRGMSGSPIIQDGKLIGAVTHVMVADPTEGYGIFIENMLNAAQSQVQPKAA